MNLQLIFVVETNSKCMSDWIYIKDTIEKFYTYDPSHTKFTVVYMNGRGNYKSREKEIKKLITQYAPNAKEKQSRVIYCFDCDDYDKNRDDEKFLRDARQYCQDRGYDFVWFCRDIESVYLGNRVDDKMKGKEAKKFKEKKMIEGVKSETLLAKDYRNNSSNLLRVLDRNLYLTRKDEFSV